MKKKHSKEFLKIIKNTSGGDDTFKAIRSITHATPLMVFWVTPDGKILDAGDAHHDNPPLGDRSVLADSKFKGHLRGRCALFGDVAYFIIYGVGPAGELTKQQLRLLSKSHKDLVAAVTAGKSDDVAEKIKAAPLVDEYGRDIDI